MSVERNETRRPAGARIRFKLRNIVGCTLAMFFISMTAIVWLAWDDVELWLRSRPKPAKPAAVTTTAQVVDGPVTAVLAVLHKPNRDPSQLASSRSFR
jgi:hypothetical protein